MKMENLSNKDNLKKFNKFLDKNKEISLKKLKKES